MTAKQAIAGIGMVIAAIALAGFWWVAVLAASSGQVFVWRNYWNAPIGTITLVIVLTVLTLGYFGVVWSFIAGWIKTRRVERRN